MLFPDFAGFGPGGLAITGFAFYASHYKQRFDCFSEHGENSGYLFA
jgi:hypothetical protein